LEQFSFVLAVSVLGQAVRNGALLELTGEAAKVEFGGALTLIHNSTEDELVCSGKIRASDVVIDGTATTVADLIGQMATLQEDMAAVKQFVGMMPPPASPPPLPKLPPHLPPPHPPPPSQLLFGNETGTITSSSSTYTPDIGKTHCGGTGCGDVQCIRVVDGCVWSASTSNPHVNVQLEHAAYVRAITWRGCGTATFSYKRVADSAWTTLTSVASSSDQWGYLHVDITELISDIRYTSSQYHWCKLHYLHVYGLRG